MGDIKRYKNRLTKLLPVLGLMLSHVLPCVWTREGRDPPVENENRLHSQIILYYFYILYFTFVVYKMSETTKSACPLFKVMH